MESHPVRKGVGGVRFAQGETPKPVSPNPFPAHGQALAALMSRKGTYFLCAAAPMIGAASTHYL